MMRAGEDGMSRETPYFVMHKKRLIENLEKVQSIEHLCDIDILHTLKSFNECSVLPTISKYISGMSIASRKELKMAKEAKATHLHLYAPAFKVEELEEMNKKIDTLSLNSLTQYETFKELECSKGIRVNPKLHLPIPNHCNPNLQHSRLGVDTHEFLIAYQEKKELFTNLEGLHFHALFQSLEQGAFLLLEHIETNFQELLPKLKWLNLGGGHNFTDSNYNIEQLSKEIKKFKKQYPNITLYFEPGESITKGCGEFVTTVVDIITISGEKIAILDTSIETHLLDVAIVNMRLKVRGTQRSSTPFFYRLAGNSCLQGDYIGEYFFQEELKIGNQVIFEDMMSYTLVKMTEFNGIDKADFYLDN